MAIAGTVDVKGTLSWTRAEFSADSRTYVWESPSSSFANAVKVSDLPSGTTSRGFTKQVSNTGSITYWYWIQHAFVTGTVGTLVGPVSGLYDGRV